MFNGHRFWRERLVAYGNELRKYGRYIFNDHLKLVLFIGFGFGAYAYQNWLGTLQEDFPVSMVIAIIMATVLVMGKIQTLLKAGDVVFLLPLEEKMLPYLKKAFWFSYVVSLVPLILGIVLIMPLYWYFYTFSTEASLLFLIGCFVLKGWHLYLSTFYLYGQEKWGHGLGTLIQWGLFAGIVYASLEGMYVGSVAGIIGLLGYTLFVSSTTKGLFKWEKAIVEDEKRLQLFYRLANLFTDIPHLKQDVKRRKWLDMCVAKYNASTNPYVYLISRTFIRSGDYLGLFLRLTILGGVTMFIVSLPYTEGIISSFFLYLLMFQLLPMWKHHQFLIWLTLYPLQEKQKKEAFLIVVKRILHVSNGCLGIVAFLASGSLVKGILAWGIGVLVILFFIRLYIPKRIEEREEWA